ncbi:extracellular solute-binding protein [Bacillus massilinigeriensis]|uniref:extracellular solute-binding protein n=1 Tax=Bacillus massilionigeriensis TaxID=1805475 RepID=UPI001F398D7B|nr:extracellular solute-binding protein [Bacillus massilionigeriensis]
MKPPIWMIALLLLSLISCSTETDKPVKKNNSDNHPLTTIKIIADGPNSVTAFKLEEEEIAKKFGVKLVFHYPDRITENVEDFLFTARDEKYDIFVLYSEKLPLYVEQNMILPLDNYINEETTSDILPIYKNMYMKYNHHDYGMIYDGGAHLLFYREDLFKKYNEEYKKMYGVDLAAPKTWEEHDRIAKFLTRDTNGDGKYDIYGTAFLNDVGMRYIWYLNRFLSKGGSYFDEDMTPLIDSDIGIEALREMVHLSNSKAVPPGATYDWTDLNSAFLQGNVAMVVQWSDTARFSYDKKTWDSKVAGKVGWTLVPGDGKTHPQGGTWLARVLAISKETDNPDKVWEVIQYITSKEISNRAIKSYDAGNDPYRQSHFIVNEKGPFSSIEENKSLLNTLEKSLENTNADLIMPGCREYMQSLDNNIGLALIGNLSPEEALEKTAKEWEQITDQYGRENQKQHYKAWLNKVEKIK